MIGAYEKWRLELFTHQIVLPGLDALSSRLHCLILFRESSPLLKFLKVVPLRYFMEAVTGIPRALRIKKSTMKNPMLYAVKKTNLKEYIKSGFKSLRPNANKAMTPMRRSLTLGEVMRNFFLSSVENPTFLASSSVSSKSNAGGYFNRRTSNTTDKGRKISNQPLVVPRHKDTAEVTANLRAKSVQLKFNRANLLSFVFTRIIPSFPRSIPQITRNTLYFRSLMPKKEI